MRVKIKFTIKHLFVMVDVYRRPSPSYRNKYGKKNVNIVIKCTWVWQSSTSLPAMLMSVSGDSHTWLKP